MSEFDDLKKGLLSGAIKRREFLTRTSALGLAAAAAPILAQQAQAMTPNKGGHLRLGTAEGSTSDVLDPAPDSSAFITMLSSTYLSQLTEVDANGNLHPLLAESFEPNEGATEWTFKLRKGVEFHDGKPLVAEDVVATLNHHRGEDSKSSLKAFANQIEDIKSSGDHEVKIILSSGNADYPFVLSTGAFSILPSKDGKVQATAGNGTGPYSLQEFDPGVRAVVQKNPNYFKDDVGHFESAEINIIADAAARQNALVSNEVDLIDKVELKTAHLLAQNEAVELLDVTGTLHYTFPMDTRQAPFNDNNVRLALKYAIDRQEIVDKVLKGYGAAGNDHPISPANRYFNTELAPRNYDPDKAKFYLKEAGLDTLTVELSASEAIWNGAIDAVVLYREQAAKAGIDIVANRVPNDGYWSNVWMKHPWAASYWSGRPTEDWMFSQGYADDSSWNETFWKNDRFNMLLREARAELDETKRRDMYWEMQEIVRDDGGAVVPIFANHLMAYQKSKLTHPEKVAGNWNLDGYKLIERWSMT
ncbi:MAG: ABC transporter substrate-binding protein [Pseudomonadota bacterium]